MKYTKGYRNLSFRSDNYNGPKGLTDGFYGFINSRKRSTFVTDSQSNDSTFTAVKRNAKLSSKQARYVKGVPFVNRRLMKIC